MSKGGETKLVSHFWRAHTGRSRERRGRRRRRRRRRKPKKGIKFVNFLYGTCMETMTLVWIIGLLDICMELFDEEETINPFFFINLGLK